MKRKDLLTDFFGLSVSLCLLLPKNTYPLHVPVFGYVFLSLLGAYLNDIARKGGFFVAIQSPQERGPPTAGVTGSNSVFGSPAVVRRSFFVFPLKRHGHCICRFLITCGAEEIKTHRQSPNDPCLILVYLSSIYCIISCKNIRWGKLCGTAQLVLPIYGIGQNITLNGICLDGFQFDKQYKVEFEAQNLWAMER